jgi:hypothetical protein
MTPAQPGPCSLGRIARFIPLNADPIANIHGRTDHLVGKLGLLVAARRRRT